MIDHDRLFKELISTFFVNLLDLFFPQMNEYIDRSSVVMLDKEVFADIGSEDKHEADLIGRVRFRDEQAFLLVHLEAQSTTHPDFERRMFHYFAWIHRKYALPVYPIVIFSHDKPKVAEPLAYRVKFPDLQVLEFSYRVVQLNRLDWRKYLRTEDPLACALMAKMDIAVEDRRK